MEHFKKNKSTNNVSMPFIFIILFSILYPCTIGVAKDNNGDTFLWKNRDNEIIKKKMVLLLYQP